MNKDKNYKLVKEYPSSPKLGYIISPKVGDGEYKYYWGGNWFDPAEHSEFWEEVIEAPKYIKLLDSEWLRENRAYRIIGVIYEVTKWNKRDVWVKCNIKVDGWKVGSSLCMDALYNHPEYYVEVTKEDYEAQFIPDYVGTYFTNEVSSRVYLIKSEVDSTISIFWETGSTTYLKQTVDKFFKEGSWIKSTKDDYDRYWKLGKYSKEVYTNCVAYVNTSVTYTLEEIGEVIEKKIGWGVLWNNIIKPELIEFKK